MTPGNNARSRDQAWDIHCVWGWPEPSCAALSSLHRQPVGVESTAPSAPSAWYSWPVKAAKRATLKGILATNTGSSLCCPAPSNRENTAVERCDCAQKPDKWMQENSLKTLFNNSPSCFSNQQRPHSISPKEMIKTKPFKFWSKYDSVDRRKVFFSFFFFFLL